MEKEKKFVENVESNELSMNDFNSGKLQWKSSETEPKSSKISSQVNIKPFQVLQFCW